MVWQRLVDPASGKPYYYENRAGVTQWEFPETLLVDVLRRHGWDKAMTDDGMMYFYNSGGESVWDVPSPAIKELRGILGSELTESEVKGVVESAAQQDAVMEVEESVAATDAAVDPESVEFEEQPVEKENVVRVNEILGITNTNDVRDVKMENDEKSDGDDASFNQMLEDKGISSVAVFKESIEKLVDDSRYWTIENPVLRKRMFDEFVRTKKANEVSAFKEKHRDGYFEYLTKRNVKYYSQWVTFKSSIAVTNEAGDEVSEIPDDIKHEFFDEFTRKLRNEKEEKTKAIKKAEIEKLEDDMMEEVVISDEFSKKLPMYEEKYKNLSKDDILTCFEKTLVALEKKQTEVFANEKIKTYRAGRKAREVFKCMLQSLIDNGEFKPHSRTRWFEFIQVVKEKPEFVELCGHRGSSAIDYYWDIIDEETEKLKGMIELVKQQLINFNTKIIDIDETKFVKLMHRSNKSEINQMNDSDLLSLYALMRGSSTVSGVKRSSESTNGNEREKRQKISLRR